MAITWHFAGALAHISSEFTKHQKIIIAYGLQQLIVRSPVDSGAYRSNHLLSFEGITEVYEPDATGNDALAIASRQLTRLTAPFSMAYIQNNLPYALKLERGSSKQAPTGIYRLAANSIYEKFK